MRFLLTRRPEVDEFQDVVPDEFQVSMCFCFCDLVVRVFVSVFVFRGELQTFVTQVQGKVSGDEARSHLVVDGREMRAAAK